MNDNNPPYYEIDLETREMLEAVLNLVGGVADLQMDDEAREDLYALGDDLATRFGVNAIKVTSEEATDEQGNEITILRYADHADKPKLSLVSNNDDPNKPAGPSDKIKH